MKNKIATTIEQSKKLLELWIDPNTADMMWTYDFTTETINELNVISEQLKPEKNDIPAWSLSALLELIPKEQHPKLILNAHYKWICEISKPIPFTYKPTVGDNPFDAVFEIVCYLKENKLI